VTARGIHAMLYAFFDAGEALDRAAMRRQTAVCLGLGMAGIAVLGLATEVAKLSESERRTLIDWTAEDINGRAPFGVTVAGNSVAEQLALARHAERAGADWVILQPPVAGQYGIEEYIDFFGRVAGGLTVPVAIQNAPAYLGRGLSAADVARLVERHPNIRLIKAEGSAVEIARLIALTQGRLPIFNGRGGLELADNLRAGCAGFILAPDLIDCALGAFRHFAEGRVEEADRAYAAMLPAATFVMQSLETLIAYGKRLFALRAGLDVHDRAPAMRPDEFGLRLVAEHAGRLGTIDI
jgi:2-keto-3-deoxy-L-arabinonate dehydratase